MPPRLATLGVFTCLAGLVGLVIFTADDCNRFWGVGSLMVGLALSLLIVRAQRYRSLVAGEFVVLGSLLATLAAATVTPARYLADKNGISALAGHYIGALNAGLPFQTNANSVAYLVAPAAVGAATLALCARSRGRMLLWLALGAFDCLLIAALGSRTALAGVAVGLLVLLLIARRPRSSMVVPFVVASCVVAVAAAVSVMREPSMTLRSQIWSSAMAMPHGVVTGMGFGGFADAQSSNTAFVVDEQAPLNVHSLYVQTILDFGLIGSVLLTIALGLSTSQAIGHLRHACRTGRSMSVLYLACVSCYLVTGLAESVLSTTTVVGGMAISLVSPIGVWLLAAPLDVACQASEREER